MAQIKTKFIENAAITAAKLGAVTDGVTLDQSGAGGTIEIKAAGVGPTQLATAAVTASTLGAVTDGVTLDQLGTGSTIEVKAGGISNTQVNASAAIDFSKLAALPAADILVGSAGNVATAVAMSGEASIVASGAVTLSNAAVIAKTLTGYTASPGTVSSSDSILSALEKIDGNTGTYANVNLSNLSSVAINSDLLPNADGTINLGSATLNYSNANIKNLIVSDTPGDSGAGATGFAMKTTDGITASTGSGNMFVRSGNFSGASGSSGQMVFKSGNATVSGGNSGNVSVVSGNVTGTGNSGAVNLKSGTSSGGTRGSVNISGNTIFLTPVVATDAGSQKIVNLANGSASSDAAAFGQIATALGAYLPLAGGTMSGNVAMGGSKVTGLGAPTINGDALRYDQLGANSGIATLDSGGKVPLSQLPASLMEYQGVWDASTNTPTLADGTGISGYFYRVDVAGTQNLGSGPQTFVVGDWVMYDGSIWQLAHSGADTVVSVNGAAGVVTVNAINELTGDATAGPASGSQAKALTLATVNSNVGSFGSSTSIPNFTVDGKGRITAAGGNAVVAPAGTLSGTTLNATVVSSSLTSVGTIATGVWEGTAVDIAHGGTGQATANAGFNALSPMTTAGDIIYEDATPVAARLAIGSTGQVLTVSGGLPTWASPASAPTTTEDILTLNSTDITNQYKDLNHPATGSSASVNSISLNVVGGPEQLKGTDYTVSLTGGSGGVTRITFAGDLATGGNAALVSGDILMVKYAY